LAYRGCRRVGYCFGGTVAVELAYTGAPLAAMIFIHGTFRAHSSKKTLRSGTLQGTGVPCSNALENCD
jgi:dienelactone hydrolase